MDGIVKDLFVKQDVVIEYWCMKLNNVMMGIQLMEMDVHRLVNNNKISYVLRNNKDHYVVMLFQLLLL